LRKENTFPGIVLRLQVFRNIPEKTCKLEDCAMNSLKYFKVELNVNLLGTTLFSLSGAKEEKSKKHSTYQSLRDTAFLSAAAPCHREIDGHEH